MTLLGLFVTKKIIDGLGELLFLWKLERLTLRCVAKADDEKTLAVLRYIRVCHRVQDRLFYRIASIL